eukprot:IDg15174t1
MCSLFSLHSNVAETLPDLESSSALGKFSVVECSQNGAYSDPIGWRNRGSPTPLEIARKYRQYCRAAFYRARWQQLVLRTAGIEKAQLMKSV